jgi:Gpi18-like mannosyltransferase
VSLPAPEPTRLSDIDWRWALPRIAMVFLVTRLLVLAVAVVVEVSQPAPPEGIRADERPLLGSLTAWDGSYYLDIAENGYHADADPFPTFGFFPAYPLLVRATSVLTFGDIGLAAVIAANVSLFGALTAIYALSVRHLRPDRAMWSLWFLLLAPGAIGFSMSYTEGLFLLFAAGAFLAAEVRRPWVAGVLLALAALTRVPGILLLLPLLVLYITRDGWRPTRAWVPLLLAPLAVALFFAYTWTLTGDPLAPLHAQDFWRLSGPNAASAISASVNGSDTATMAIGEAPSFVIALWIATIAFYAFLFVYFRHDRIGPAYWIVGILAIVGVFASGKLLSAPRYVVVAWPFYWVLANRASLVGRLSVLAVFAMLQVVLLWLAFTWQVPP